MSRSSHANTKAESVNRSLCHSTAILLFLIWEGHLFLIVIGGDPSAAGAKVLLLGLLVALGVGGLAGLSGNQAGVALLDGGNLDTLLLGQSDGELIVAVAQDEDVAGAGGELMAVLVLQVGNIEGTGVLLDADNLSDTSTVGSAGEHGNLAGAHLDDLVDLAGGGVDQEGVADGGLGGRIADAAAVVGGGDGDAASGGEDVSDLAELDVALSLANLDLSEAALDVVQQTEAVAALGDLDDVHEAGGELGVDADAAVDLDQALTEDHLTFAGVQSVLQAVAEDDQEWEALADLVGSTTGARSEDASQLAEHPVLRSEESLQVQTWATSHDYKQ